MELKVVFRNSLRQKLIGVLSYQNISSPGVILCHGFCSSKDGHFFPRLAEELVKKGFAVLRFDCRGCGESEGKYHPTYKTMIDDVKAAITFMKKQDINSVSLAGHSMGGTTALMTASKVSHVITYGAVAHPKASIEGKKKLLKKEGNEYTLEFNKRTYYFTEDTFIDAVDPLSAVKKISCPKLFLHGDADRKVDVSQGRELYAAAKDPKKLVLLKGITHSFRGAYDEVIKASIKFLKK